MTDKYRDNSKTAVTMGLEGSLDVSAQMQES